MKHYTIYQTTNTVNGKVYVGKHVTEDPNDDYLGSGKQLRRAIAKYGRDKFTKEVLHVFNSEDEMNLKEKELVTEEFCARPDTYNICEGGKGGFGYINSNGLGVSVKQKKAAIATCLNRKGIPLTGAALLSAKENLKTATLIRDKKYPNGTFFNKRHSEDTIARISASQKGRQAGAKNSQYGSVWITNGLESKKVKVDSTLPAGWSRGRVVHSKILHLPAVYPLASNQVKG